MAALYLSEAEVAELLDMRLAIDVVEDAFRKLSAGEAANVPRTRVHTPGIVLHSMTAAAPSYGMLGWKCYTTTRTAAHFHIGLYDTTSGELQAILAGDHLGRMRTGATTGVAAQWMAPLDAHEMGLFGAGKQAETQLAAVNLSRPLKRAFVYSRNEEKRVDFCERMSASLGIEVTPVDRPQEAAEELPIVVTATASREPVFDGSWLAEDAFVAAVGSNWMNRAELDSSVIRLADNIVCDSVEACKAEAGDFADARRKGIFNWSRAVDLAEVVAGRAVGRSRADSLTLFKSVGMAIEDVALGAKVFQLAKAAGIGVELPF